jgi:hypothetical protein
MASIVHANLQLPPPTRQSMAQLIADAKRMGVPPEDYAKRLIEEGLSIQREAEEKTFRQIMGPIRRAAGKIGDAEILALVERARPGHSRGNGRGKKR